MCSFLDLNTNHMLDFMKSYVEMEYQKTTKVINNQKNSIDCALFVIYTMLVVLNDSTQYPTQEKVTQFRKELLEFLQDKNESK